MELYQIGSILLDISIATLVLRAVIRLVLVKSYFKQNGNRSLTDEQRKSLRRKIAPIGIVGLLLAIAALVLLVI